MSREKPKKILGVDYGDVRTGLALSDGLLMLAHEAGVITERNAERAAQIETIRAAIAGSRNEIEKREEAKPERCAAAWKRKAASPSRRRGCARSRTSASAGT